MKWWATLGGPALVALVLQLSGCAGTNPESLRPAQSSRVAVLNAPYQYEEYYRMSGNRMIYTLAAGEYKPRYEDDEGTYFEGRDNCFEVKIISDTLTQQGKPQFGPRSYRCGIYLAKRADAMPKVYFYRDPEASAAVFDNTTVAPGARPGTGTGLGVARAIDAAELKNLHFYYDQPKDDSLKRAVQVR